MTSERNSLLKNLSSFKLYLNIGLRGRCFHWILQNSEQLIYRTPLRDCFCKFCLALSIALFITQEAVFLSFISLVYYFFKGYFRFKTNFCHKVALDVQLMIFFIWRSNRVSFSRYLHFSIFMKSTDFKTRDVIKYCYTMELTLMIISLESQALSKWNLVKY